MHLRTIAAGLSALVLLSTGVQARGLLDLIKLPTPEHTARSGSISQHAALDLYSSKEKQLSFDACVDLFPGATPINTASVPATPTTVATAFFQELQEDSLMAAISDGRRRHRVPALRGG